MNKFFRFGLPIGSAVVVTAILHWFSSIRLLFSTFDAFFPRKELYTEDYITIGCSLIAVILTVVLWTQVIFQGSRHMGIFWFVAAVLNCTIQIIQSSYDLIYQKNHNSAHNFYAMLWALIVSICTSIYVYIVAGQMVSSYMIEDELNSFRDILKPIGQRCTGIFQYYQGNPKLGAKVFLTADIVWSAFVLIAYEFPKCDFRRFDWLHDFGESDVYFFTGTAGTIVSVEEVYMRIFRVLLGLIGCRLIRKRAANLKPWLFMQLCGIAASIILYIILFAFTTDWASQICGYLYQMLFTCDIVYRFVVLHFCIEFKRDLDMISVV